MDKQKYALFLIEDDKVTQFAADTYTEAEDTLRAAGYWRIGDDWTCGKDVWAFVRPIPNTDLGDRYKVEITVYQNEEKIGNTAVTQYAKDLAAGMSALSGTVVEKAASKLMQSIVAMAVTNDTD